MRGDVYFQSALALSTVELQQYSTKQSRGKRVEDESTGLMQTPTKAPTNETKTPTPPTHPTMTVNPTKAPTAPTDPPTTLQPTAPTKQPTTDAPTEPKAPTLTPTEGTLEPTKAPSHVPTEPTNAPTEAPTHTVSPLSPSSIVILVFVLLLLLALVIGGLIWLRRKKNPWIMNFLNPSKHHAYEEITSAEVSQTTIVLLRYRSDRVKAMATPKVILRFLKFNRRLVRFES